MPTTGLNKCCLRFILYFPQRFKHKHNVKEAYYSFFPPSAESQHPLGLTQAIYPTRSTSTMCADDRGESCFCVSNHSFLSPLSSVFSRAVTWAHPIYLHKCFNIKTLNFKLKFMCKKLYLHIA